MGMELFITQAGRWRKGAGSKTIISLFPNSTMSPLLWKRKSIKSKNLTNRTAGLWDMIRTILSKNLVTKAVIITIKTTTTPVKEDRRKNLKENARARRKLHLLDSPSSLINCQFIEKYNLNQSRWRVRGNFLIFSFKISSVQGIKASSPKDFSRFASQICFSFLKLEEDWENDCTSISSTTILCSFLWIVNLSRLLELSLRIPFSKVFSSPIFYLF